MKQEKMDFAKVLAILAQPKEAPKPLENVDKVKMEISYITKDNKVEKRPIHMFLPKEAQRPMPLVFVPHYEMAEDALELRAYLKKGWAVASVTDFNDIYNGQLTDDDLVFNNAVLYTLRHLPEIDKMRIAVVGGSAGGYTAMMLSALQLGICCTVANAPIDNIYFTFYHYFKKVNHMNQRALEKISTKNRM